MQTVARVSWLLWLGLLACSGRKTDDIGQSLAGPGEATESKAKATSSKVNGSPAPSANASNPSANEAVPATPTAAPTATQTYGMASEASDFADTRGSDAAVTDEGPEETQRPGETQSPGRDVPTNVEWTEQLGTSKQEVPSAVAIDAAGNIFIAGTTQGAFDDLGQAYADGDAFLSKFSRDGALLWTYQLGTKGADLATGVAIDADGNVFVSGGADGAFGDLGEGAEWLDAFLSKFTNDGVLLWTHQLGTDAVDVATGVAVDATGNAFITGTTTGGEDIRSGNAFLSKFTSSGTLLWTSYELGSNYSRITLSYLTLDENGSVYVVGDTREDLGEQGKVRGFQGVYMSKFTTDGVRQSNQLHGSDRVDWPNGIVADGAAAGERS